MKKHVIALAALVLTTPTLAAEKSAPMTIKAVTASTEITWTGRKVTGSHTGGLALKSGEATLDGDKLIQATFEMDMTSITNKDLTDKALNDKLIGHLKSPDFFDVEKFPVAMLKIAKAEKGAKSDHYTLSGELTIKGQTQPISFDAKVTRDKEGVVTAEAEKITFDRTKFNVRYGSGSFFQGLGDKLIYDEVELAVKIVLK